MTNGKLGTNSLKPRRFGLNVYKLVGVVADDLLSSVCRFSVMYNVEVGELVELTDIAYPRVSLA